MKYFFILGKNPALSVAELYAVFPSFAQSFEVISSDAMTADLDISENEAGALINKIGGTIKIGMVIEEIKKGDDILLEKIISLEMEKILQYKKIIFGISGYGRQAQTTKPLGLKIKKILKDKNVRSRFVISREKNLSSVVVEQNKILKQGLEIVLIAKEKSVIIGKTLSVQPFKELSKRDYGRPARDSLSGMIPPKLAQIMINLARINSKARQTAALLDPFCGSGTILTEAALMGYDNLIGSDISQKAIEDTSKNIEWTCQNHGLKVKNLKLINAPAGKISEKIAVDSVDAIATEPYLGPQRGKIDLKKIIPQLENLYSQSIKEFFKILKPNGLLVMLFPIFFNKFSIKPDLNRFKIINPIPENLRNNQFIKLTARNTIIYGREGQKVWREIIILKK